MKRTYYIIIYWLFPKIFCENSQSGEFAIIILGLIETTYFIWKQI